jgi:CRP-like cAMP-binding protein
MPIRVKVARSSKELQDVLQLRYDVYTNEEGLFANAQHDGASVIVDKFDALPLVSNIVAYNGSEAIGTIRLNLDSDQGLPPEELYDYSSYRKRITEEWKQSHGKAPVFGSAGMLAIKKPWRHRRDVIGALLKVGACVGRAWEATHLFAAVSTKTSGMYQRMSFESLHEQLWVEEVGDFIVPMASPLDIFYEWTCQGLIDNDTAIFKLFSNRFQRLILRSGEVLFNEGDEGKEAYIIDTGTIRVSQYIEDTGSEKTLATLGHGSMIGEISLIDKKARSAHAIALTNTELIALDHEDFVISMQERGSMQSILEFLAARIRRTDELISALHGSAAQRMKHALEDIKSTAIPDQKRPGVLLAKLGLIEFATNAGVTEHEAHGYLEEQRMLQLIEYTNQRIRFLQTEPKASEKAQRILPTIEHARDKSY